MYKVKYTDYRKWPWAILRLVDLDTGEEKDWLTSAGHEEMLCKELGLKVLEGHIIPHTPWGEWATKEKLDDIP